MAAGQAIGTIQPPGQDAEPLSIVSPVSGVIAANDTRVGRRVLLGDQLATVYSPLFVTARIPRDKVAQIQPGLPADIEVVGQPQMTGIIAPYPTVVAEFSLFPDSPETRAKEEAKRAAPFPVRINITGPPNTRLTLGAAATVTIHRKP